MGERSREIAIAIIKKKQQQTPRLALVELMADEAKYLARVSRRSPPHCFPCCPSGPSLTQVSCASFEAAS